MACRHPPAAGPSMGRGALSESFSGHFPIRFPSRFPSHFSVTLRLVLRDSFQSISVLLSESELHRRSGIVRTRCRGDASAHTAA